MKYNIMDYKLKIIVEEIGEEYKDLLIERIFDDMQENDVDYINPSDLIRLDIATKASLRNDKKVQQKDHILSAVSMIGMGYSSFGLMLMMWSDMRERMHYDSLMLMSFVLTFSGLFVAVFSTLIKTILKSKPNYYKQKGYSIASYEIVNKWKEVEILVRQLTPEENVLPLSIMLKNLKDIKIISEQDIETINRLLSLRNQSVHGSSDNESISPKELRALFIQIDKIISKMKKLV